MARHLSYTEMKHEIFDYLANHFEETGTTITVSLDDVSLALGQKPVRAKRAIESLVDENVLIEDSSEPGSYRLSPLAYMQLVQNLESAGRLPQPPSDAGEDFNWLNEGHVFLAPIETPLPINISTSSSSDTPSKAIIKILEAKATALNLKIIDIEGVNDETLAIALEGLKHARSSLDKSGDQTAVTGVPELGLRLIVGRAD